MKIGVFGPREQTKGVKYTNYTRVSEVLDTYEITQLVSGGGFGVEQLGLRYAAENGIEDKVVPPHINALGPKLAFERRNEEIGKTVDIAVVLWDGKERYYAELIGKLTPLCKAVHSYIY